MMPQDVELNFFPAYLSLNHCVKLVIKTETTQELLKNLKEKKLKQIFEFSFHGFQLEIELIVISLPWNGGTLHHVLLFSPACSTRGISIIDPHG